MSHAISVFSALPALGFLDCGSGELEWNHPQCQLGAVEACTPFPVVCFSGHYHYGRSMGFIEFCLPAQVESLDQLKAFLAYYLKDAVPDKPPLWLVEGQMRSGALPWERELAVVDARDKCHVRRAWLKLALKELALSLAERPAHGSVTLSFDGTLLTMDCGRKVVVQADGSPWHESYRVSAQDFQRLPKRLMADPVEVSVWKQHLRIAGSTYRLVEEAATRVDLVVEQVGAQQAPPPVVASEDPEDHINEVIMAACPYHWPGQQIVELHNLDDAGSWIENNLSGSAADLLLNPSSDCQEAQWLAESYLRDVRDRGYPLPSDFSRVPDHQSRTEDDESQVKEEFVAFLKCWRERAGAALVQQRPPSIKADSTDDRTS